MVRTHKDVMRSVLSDEEIRREYDALEPEYELRRALLHLRQALNVTQQKLADGLGTKQEYISRIERGHVDLTVSYLARLLDALDADLEVVIRPRDAREPIKTRITVSAASNS